MGEFFNAKKQRNILIVVLILLVFGFGYGVTRMSGLKNQLAISEQNNKALSDSVRVEKNKVGDLEYSKNILVAEKNELADLNADLAEELDKEKGKVRELTKIVGSISNTDTVYIENTLIVYADGSHGLQWEHDTIYDDENSRHLAGISKFFVDSLGVITPLETEITKDIINFNIVTGLREKDGNIEVFARSDYPNFEVEELSSAIIDPKKHPVLKKFTRPKRIGIGPYIGVGISSGFKAEIQLGIGVQYSLFRF